MINTDSVQLHTYHIRRRRYIDKSIQGRLITGILTLEVLLFTIALWLIYLELRGTIDVQLYRIHQPDPDSDSVLLMALLQSAPYVIGVNVLVLLGIDHTWKNFLNGIVEPLRSIVQRMLQLDLRHKHNIKPAHAVLAHAAEWIESQRIRCTIIRQLVQRLPDNPDLSQPDQKAAINKILTEIQQQLP